MIAHSDNTATDTALAAAGSTGAGTDRRGRVKGDPHPQFDPQPVLLARGHAGRVSMSGWAGMKRLAGAPLGRDSRPAINKRRRWLDLGGNGELVPAGAAGRVLQGARDARENKRIQAKADAIVHVVPTDTWPTPRAAASMGGHHGLACAGQMSRQGPGDLRLHDQLDRGPDDGVARKPATDSAVAVGPTHTSRSVETASHKLPNMPGPRVPLCDRGYRNHHGVVSRIEGRRLVRVEGGRLPSGRSWSPSRQMPVLGFSTPAYGAKRISTPIADGSRLTSTRPTSV